MDIVHTITMRGAPAGVALAGGIAVSKNANGEAVLPAAGARVIGSLDLNGGIIAGDVTTLLNVHVDGIVLAVAGGVIPSAAGVQPLMVNALGRYVVLTGANAHVADYTPDLTQAPQTIADGDTIKISLVSDGAASPLLQIAIADPGDAGAIPVTDSGWCYLTSGAIGETRTLAIPTFDGQTIYFTFDVDGIGDIVITAAADIDQSGASTSLTFADAGDHLALVAAQTLGVLVWRTLANDGVALA